MVQKEASSGLLPLPVEVHSKTKQKKKMKTLYILANLLMLVQKGGGHISNHFARGNCFDLSRISWHTPWLNKACQLLAWKTGRRRLEDWCIVISNHLGPFLAIPLEKSRNHSVMKCTKVTGKTPRRAGSPSTWPT